MMEYKKNDPQTIQSLFNSIAEQYDKTNAVLSFQMYKRWNRALIEKAIMPAKPKILLDLCCGTGAIAFDYLRKEPNSLKAYLLDFSEGMLEYAKKRAQLLSLERHDIHYLQADAQTIPLQDASVNCATISYGIRNVKDPRKCIKDVFRVLAPEGTFGVLELTKPENSFLRFGHHLYLKTLLPLMGKLLTSNKEAYSYLCNSIHSFISPKDLEHLMFEAGFQNITQYSFFGGVATLLVGKKNKSISIS